MINDENFLIAQQEQADALNAEAFTGMSDEQKRKREVINEALKILTDNGIFGTIIANIHVDKDRELPIQINNMLTLSQFNDLGKMTWESYRQGTMLNCGLNYHAQAAMVNHFKNISLELSLSNILGCLSYNYNLMVKWGKMKAGDTPQEVKGDYQEYLKQ